MVEAKETAKRTANLLEDALGVGNTMFRYWLPEDGAATTRSGSELNGNNHDDGAQSLACHDPILNERYLILQYDESVKRMLPGISTMKGTRCRVNFNYLSSTLSPYESGAQGMVMTAISMGLALKILRSRYIHGGGLSSS